MIYAPSSPQIETSINGISFHYILGLRFHSLTMNETLDWIEHFIKERKPRQISFSNAQTIALSRKNPELRRLLNQSDLTLADGMSVVWGARILGYKLPERVAGPDLTFALAGRAAKKNYRVFLMGSSWGNLSQLKNVLTNAWGGLNVVGMHSPPMCEKMSEEETKKIILLIRNSTPDILFVGISCPKQEQWIAENLSRINVPVSLGVGAAFDFLSGRIPRAPEWLRKRGLEWLFRLWCEPRRLWRRYLLGNFVFLSLLLKEKIRRQFFASSCF